MQPQQQPFPERDSRVLVLSQRRLHQPVFQALQYEFEDLLLDLDDVQILAPLPEAGTAGTVRRRIVNGARRRTGRPRRTPPGNRPGMRSVQLVTEHDLMFVVIHDAYQLSYLRRVSGWRQRCKRTVCFLMETWTTGVERDADYYEVLREFDAVYMFTPQAAPSLRSLGAPAPAFLAVGVDALAAMPGPRPPDRSIDVYTYGRTSPVVHEQLLREVTLRGLTYIYDSMNGTSAPDHRQHRALVSNLIKRSQFCLAHRINDSPERRARTGGEESLSTRYFEATAGGAVILGSEPLTPDFSDCFDWPDAVIPLDYEEPAVADILRALMEQPERLFRASRAGVLAGLLRHDWAYRWKRILDDAGLGPHSGLVNRMHRLEAAAVSTRSTA